MFNRLVLATVIAFSLSACGGGGGSSSNTSQPPVVPTPTPTPTPPSTPAVFTGIFLDSAVQNLNYATPSVAGKTSDKGEFEFANNEFVVFSIGNIQFPAVYADTYITPLDIFATSDVNHTSVVNMLRLLQSLDIDGDPTNGIVIPDVAVAYAKPPKLKSF
jgi:hypothetical protein